MKKEQKQNQLNKNSFVSKVAAVGIVIVAGATQASAAILTAGSEIDMTEFMLMATVVAGSYLVIKGVQKALGLLRGA